MPQIGMEFESHTARLIEKYEPGDVTRYTLMYSIFNNEVFIAIGAGQRLQGGYPLALPSLRRAGLKMKEAKDGEEFVRVVSDVLDMARYWEETAHAGVKDAWTANVAILAAIVIACGSLRQHGHLPGLMNRRRHEEALALCQEFFV